MTTFADSSALVAALLREDASARVGEILADAEVVVLASVTRVEVRSALARARRGARISARKERRLWEEFEQTWSSSGVLVVDDELIADATDLSARHLLCTDEAIQLAAGLVAAAELGATTFLTLDPALNAAAAAEGLDCLLRDNGVVG